MIRTPALAFILLTALACLALGSFAQTPARGVARATPAPSASAPREVAKPAWKDLTPAQREALSPLAADWDGFDRTRKAKWLDVANKYPQLSPEGQKRLHERMVQFVKLTPEQKRTARSNFQRAYELPMEQRQTLVQQYQELPPEKKQALADKASKKAEPPRRRATKPDQKAEQKVDEKPDSAKP
jgi:Protein of unknown function (DUF3106)